MNLYFVSYYCIGTHEYIGLFELYNIDNLYRLKYVFGGGKRNKQKFLDRIDGPVYFIPSLTSQIYNEGYPFKPEYLNNLVSKEELDGLLLC